MNHYYANGAPIFENPRIKHLKPSNESIGYLEEYIHKKGLKFKYKLNEKTRQPDLYIISGKESIVFPWRNSGWNEGEYDEAIEWVNEKSK